MSLKEDTMRGRVQKNRPYRFFPGFFCAFELFTCKTILEYYDLNFISSSFNLLVIISSCFAAAPTSSTALTF